MKRVCAKVTCHDTPTTTLQKCDDQQESEPTHSSVLVTLHRSCQCSCTQPMAILIAQDGPGKGDPFP
jgi:hypothetical protein